MKRSPIPIRFAALALAVAVAASACSSFESRVTNPNEGEPLFDIFFEIPDGEAAASSVPAPDFAVELSDGQGNTLIIQGARVVVREMEIGRQTGECTDAASSEEDDGDACTEFTVEPQALTIPVDRMAVQIVNQFPVQSGVYDRLQFDVHRLTQEDGQAFQSNPLLRNRSLRLTGSYNESDFTVTLAPEQELNLSFSQTIDTQSGATSRITLQADLSSWFRAEDGSLIDPRSLEGDAALQDRVAGQILDSFSIQLGPPEETS